MRYIFLILTLCTFLYSQQTPASWWQQSSQAQKDSIRASYDWGKPYDLGFTFAAYDWHESGGGLWRVNLENHEYGRYHQRADFLADEIHGRKTNTWERSRIAEKLLFNLEWDRQQVLRRLTKAREKYHGDYMKVWSKWNSGNGNHAVEIRDKVRFLRSLGWK